MWKLTLLLCGAMFLVLLIGGQDRGQLRPGLALAEAERAANPAPATPEVPEAPILITADDRAPDPAPKPVPEAGAEPVASPAPVPQTAPSADPAELAAPAPLPQVAAPAPSKPAIPFSVGLGLSEPDRTPPLPPTVPAQETGPTAAPTGGQILYVSANSVNVRQDPSTDALVLGRLTRGEPAAVMWEEGADWLRVEALNSGLEGYVARRFLTPEQP